MFSILLEDDGKTPIYRQLSAAILQAIKSGRLAPGDLLPSAQELADSVGLSRRTVAKSYAYLVAQGFLEGIPGSGTLVKRDQLVEKRLNDDFSGSIKPVDELTNGLTSLSEYGKGLASLEITRSCSADLPELNFGAPPMELLPISKWKELLLKYCRTLKPDQFQDRQEVFGLLSLREALVSFLRRTRGVDCNAEQVIIFNGSQGPLDRVIRLLVNSGDLCVVENPGYAGVRQSLQAMGAQLNLVDVDNFGIRVDQLRTIADRVKFCHITPSHHDPSGVTMSAERRSEFLEWASLSCEYIIEDAWDSDFYYGVQAPPAIQSSARHQTFYIYTFWKLLFPLSSLGVLVVPRHLVDIFQRAMLLSDWAFPIPEHYVLTELLSDGYLENHISRVFKKYRVRRQRLLHCLSCRFMRELSFSDCSASLHQLIQFASPIDHALVLQSAAKVGLPLMPTARFYGGTVKDGEYLLPFANIPEAKIDDLVNRFAAELGY